jgi:hypothetical protein
MPHPPAVGVNVRSVRVIGDVSEIAMLRVALGSRSTALRTVRWYIPSTDVARAASSLSSMRFAMLSDGKRHRCNQGSSKKCKPFQVILLATYQLRSPIRAYAQTMSLLNAEELGQTLGNTPVLLM